MVKYEIGAGNEQIIEQRFESDVPQSFLWKNLWQRFLKLTKTLPRTTKFARFFACYFSISIQRAHLPFPTPLETRWVLIFYVNTAEKFFRLSRLARFLGTQMKFIAKKTNALNFLEFNFVCLSLKFCVNT